MHLAVCSVFRTTPNIYDGAILQKQLTATEYTEHLGEM